MVIATKDGATIKSTFPLDETLKYTNLVPALLDCMEKELGQCEFKVNRTGEP